MGPEIGQHEIPDVAPTLPLGWVEVNHFQSPARNERARQ